MDGRAYFVGFLAERSLWQASSASFYIPTKGPERKLSERLDATATLFRMFFFQNPGLIPSQTTVPMTAETEGSASQWSRAKLPTAAIGFSRARPVRTTRQGFRRRTTHETSNSAD
jgi:hypothetical protein